VKYNNCILFKKLIFVNFDVQGHLQFKDRWSFLLLSNSCILKARCSAFQCRL